MGGNLTGGKMKIYVGIDMAKDKFDYCTMDDDLNILFRGDNCHNDRSAFDSFGKTLEDLKPMTRQMTIGMESTGIYHLPLYMFLRNNGYHVRILNGLEVRGMKKARVRKTTNDGIDAQSIARYLMVSKDMDSYDYPEELKNLRELVTALDILNTKIVATKNNIIRIMDMEFRGLSNILDLDHDTVNLLSKYHTASDFISADESEMEKYVTKAKIKRIRSVAEKAPELGNERKALDIELKSLLRILDLLLVEKENITEAMEKEFVTLGQIITTIPGIGPITGAVIMAKIGNIERFENAGKLVAFSGIDPVIKESGKIRSERSISKRGDPMLRTAIYQSTVSAIRCNPVISDFYHRLTERGVPKKKALIASSRKMCHIIFSVMHNNKPFEVPEKFRKESAS
jgi:transposase